MFCIAMDLHKENTYCAVLDNKSGQTAWEGNIASTFSAAKEALEPYFVKGTRIAIEATSCFYPMYDGLKTVEEIDVCVVNTTKLEKPAIKTDPRDAKRIAHLLYINGLPTAYIPDKEMRLYRELCSLRVRLVQSCTQCKNRVHAILLKEGKRPFFVKDVFGKKGRAQLKKVKEEISRGEELEEELDLLKILEKKTQRVEKQIEEAIKANKVLSKQVELIDSIPGFAQTLAFVCATEISTIKRFKSEKSLVAYAGMHPCVDSSGGKVRHGRIRRVGRKLFRWALIEAAHAAGRSKSAIGKYYHKKAKQKKSKHAAAIATANKLARIMYEVLAKQEPYNT